MLKIQQQQRNATRLARASQAGVRAALNSEAQLAAEEQLPSRFEAGAPTVRRRSSEWNTIKARMAKAKPGKFKSGQANVLTGALAKAAKSPRVRVSDSEAVVEVVSPHPVHDYQVQEIMRPTSGERKRQVEAALQQLQAARRVVPIENVRV